MNDVKIKINFVLPQVALPFLMGVNFVFHSQSVVLNDVDMKVDNADDKWKTEMYKKRWLAGAILKRR